MVIEAVSSGGIVIHKGKVLLLYKNKDGRYLGWVMPKGTTEKGETLKATALREVKEECSVTGNIVRYIDKTQYRFRNGSDIVNKTVHWYLMSTDSFYCKPQAEEFFFDAGFYKQHEAYYLLKFHDEKQVMKKAYEEYRRIQKKNSFKYKKESYKNNKIYFKNF